MKFTVTDGNGAQNCFDAVGFAFYDGAVPDEILKPLGGLADTIISVANRENFNWKKGSVTIPVAEGSVRVVTLSALGPKAELCEDSLREAAFKIVRESANRACAKIALFVADAGEPLHSRSVGEGALLALYRFDKYKKKDDDDRFAVPEEISLIGGVETELMCGVKIAEAQTFARDLVNEPGNIMNPKSMESVAWSIAGEYSLEIESLDSNEIKDKGMGALWAVGSGSSVPPYLVRLAWKPETRPKARIIIVGKGLTFDSGGLSLKPADSMVTMKGDKTGACVVMGVMRAAAALKLPVELHAIMGLAENMPGGAAYRPDDVLRAYNGKTIEVNNTDAEGRLTLADALSYASEFDPDAILDIATLTGA